MVQKLLTLKQMSNLLLGFSEDSTPSKDQISAAYRKAAFLFHPDRGGSSETFRALCGAKEILKSDTHIKPSDDFDNYESNKWARRSEAYEEQRKQREQQKWKSTDIPW